MKGKMKMKAISQKSQKVLETLLSKMEYGYAKIDNSNGAFMPVIVEAIGDDCYSVAHYYKQNGDLIPDPEMVFWKGDDGKFYPTYFKNVFGEQETVLFEDEKPTEICPRLQRDHVTFANQWLANIKEQQGV